MTTGRNEFPVKIDRAAIAEIADAVEAGVAVYPEGVTRLIMAGAPRKDIHVALVALAILKFLESRNCQPDFQVVFGE